MESPEVSVFGKVCDVAEGFRKGLHGQYQARKMAATLVEGDENIEVVSYLLLEIHHDGRKLAARSCPFAGRQY